METLPMVNKLVQSFISRVEKEKIPAEGILWAEGSLVLGEHHFVPDKPRNIYSHTKSFMSTAVGIAIEEGLLKLEDRPAEFFEDSLPDQADEKVWDITLKHLLTMSSGFDEGLLMMGGRYQGEGAPDYIRYIFSHPVKTLPGSQFHYSNGDSFLAGCMVEKKAGMTLREYLSEKVFQPLDMPLSPQWEHCPMGHTFGASGLCLRLADMAKLGMTYVQEGVYRGRRIIPTTWVEQAARVHIATPESQTDNGWSCGYGYQIWKLPYGKAYRFDGAYSQFTCIFPEKNLIVAVQTTESERSWEVRRALHEEIFSKL